MNINISEAKLFNGKPLDDDTLLFVCTNNWFLHVDPFNPDNTEWYTTTVAGDPFAPRKLFQVRIHPGPPWVQPVMEELDLKDDKTIGGIQPLVCVTPNGTFVAVQDKPRHNGVVTEAFRKSWSNPAEAPVLLTNGGAIRTYTDTDLGRGLANDARIVALDRLGQIKYELTVIKNAKDLPTIDKGYWMEIESFIFGTVEHMGKGVVLLGVYAGHIPQADPEKLKSAIAALPEFIKKLSE